MGLAVVLVPTNDASLRFWVHYRRFNAGSRHTSYPILRTEYCIDSLGGAYFLATLDKNSSYWKINIADKYQQQTALITHHGHFEYRRIPLILNKATATFERVLNIILVKYEWCTCLVYMDDIVVFSKSISQHLRRVQRF